MEKNIEMTLLYDIYGILLTDKQKDIFTEYYIYNLSLREIAQNKKISYQAVRDSLQTSENMLNNFESKLHVCRLNKKFEDVCNHVKKENKDSYLKEDVLDMLSSIVSRNEDDI